MQHSAQNPYPARLLALCTAGATLLLAGCDYLGIESTVQVAEQKAAEGKAIGGACRHANRALEDCFRYNPKANKAAVFTGWKEMDQYMRENKLEGTPSVIGAPPKPAASDSVETEPGNAAASKKS